MSTHHITVTTTSGETIQTATTDPDTARQFETLPFESQTVVSVDVSVDVSVERGNS
ncbi:hypothetical protein [Streptomyces sp. NPDC053720]|uniref:hypothetical protein n=1 Tax=Streptomyces sp. NPDC053720 TaxID=3154855 RepID=UPI003414FFDE